MKTYKITIREFPDKKPSERYSYTFNHLTRGWFSLNQVMRFIKLDLQELK